MELTPSQLAKHWPNAGTALWNGVAAASAAVFAKYEIDTPLRVAHFMAQISHESAGGSRLVENLNYSAQRLMEVWPKRFPTLLVATPYERNAKALAIKVYGSRLGNRPGTDDGWTYRGHGLIQLTGLDAYVAIKQASGLDIVTSPEIASAPESCLEIAAALWAWKKINPYADDDDLRRVTLLINGGYVGMNARAAWLKTWKAEIGV